MVVAIIIVVEMLLPRKMRCWQTYVGCLCVGKLRWGGVQFLIREMLKSGRQSVTAKDELGVDNRR